MFGYGIYEVMLIYHCTGHKLIVLDFGNLCIDVTKQSYPDCNIIWSPLLEKEGSSYCLKNNVFC